MAQFLKTHNYRSEDILPYVVRSQAMQGTFYVGDELQIVKWGG